MFHSARCANPSIIKQPLGPMAKPTLPTAAVLSCPSTLYKKLRPHRDWMSRLMEVENAA
jgi:hypothetical protein